MAEVSVIVPIYNMEKYLGQCIDSILAQTFSDWELILVNDGSKDGTSDICHRYAAKDSRIIVLDQENHGLVYSVGAGLRKASGTYVMFLDHDDWYEKDMIEILHKSLLEHDADCVMGGYKKVYESGREEIALPLQDAVYEKKDIEEKILKPFFEKDADIYRRWSSPRWDKIYKTDLLKSVYYEKDMDIVMGEDLEMQLRYLAVCDRIVSLGNCYRYCYRVLEKSMARGYSPKMKKEYEDLVRALEKAAFEQGRTFLAKNTYEDVCHLYMLTELARTAGMDQEEKKEIRKTLVSEMHDKKLLYKQLLNADFPGRQALQNIYRKIRNR